ncbi:NCS2 family permease [Megasphaera paucivorans]|uniref:Putative MFS transporter, AGZA family, xanthine/uracil permease n=1 Tax=Megasphaera paucivorans TaxID=349095 RepID=A0A1G9U4A8_9FIRM|nr:NCS2 family permease [Megasphaera paucivorans]SDM54819.1 putative MFS transporter, AGZA family, xanthine/uracil permease [Megasphaera paucivorans]
MYSYIQRICEQQFQLKAWGTSVSTEIIAGMTTFATMAYVLAVVPKMMGEAGLPAGEILTAMVMMIFFTTLAMGLYTNRPFALAPGMGGVAIFSITLVQLQHVSVGIASAIVFLSGCLFLIVTVLGIREAIVMVIPKGIKISISAGVGMFLAVIGLRNAKVLAANASKVALSLGDISQPVVVLAAMGLFVLLALEARKVRGAALISIVIATIIGIPLGVTKIPAAIFAVPSGINEVFFNFDLMGALDVRYIPYLFVFFLPDFFSSFGTAIGIGGKAGFLDKNGDLPDLNKIFQVDSIAATLGSFFTIPVLITYLESGAGVEAGGRTGLTAVTTAVMFLLVLAITPAALMIPAAATAPVLLYVGVSMMAGMRNLDYSDMAEYVPAFLCIAFTAFTFNIANGISLAFLAYVIIKLASRRYREMTWGHYLLALLLLYYFYSMAGVK